MKKRKGAIEEMFSLFFGILISVVIVVLFLYTVNVVSIDADINRIGRKYLLEMETQGYLTASARTELEQQLRDMGATEIDFTGTTMSEPGYGNPIYLEVTVRIPLRFLNTDAGLTGTFTEQRIWTYTISQVSTAKY